MALSTGDVIHGFAEGYFGRDSYECRRVEHVGPDYVVTRSYSGRPELLVGMKAIAHVSTIADDRAFCDEGCVGPEVVRHAD